jgi:hypothetical protein
MADDTTGKKPSRAVKKLWERQRYDNYFQALGEFVHCFTTAEHAVSSCLLHHAKVNTDVYRAVFSGVRMKEGISFLRRLSEVGEIDPREWEKVETPSRSPDHHHQRAQQAALPWSRWHRRRWRAVC